MGRGGRGQEGMGLPSGVPSGREAGVPYKCWLAAARPYFMSANKGSHHLLRAGSGKPALDPCQQDIRRVNVLADNLPLARALGFQGGDQPDVLQILRIL